MPFIRLIVTNVILIINQSIILFSQLRNNIKINIDTIVKHSDGLPEKQIAHLSWSLK